MSFLNLQNPIKFDIVYYHLGSITGQYLSMQRGKLNLVELLLDLIYFFKITYIL